MELAFNTCYFCSGLQEKGVKGFEKRGRRDLVEIQLKGKIGAVEIEPKW